MKIKTLCVSLMLLSASILCGHIYSWGRAPTPGEVALTRAAESCSIEDTKKALQEYPEMTVNSGLGLFFWDSPLMLGAKNLEYTQFLLSIGAVDEPNVLGRTALAAAAELGNLEVCKLLVEVHEESSRAEYVCKADVMTNTALLRATTADVAQFLLDQGANCHDTGYGGEGWIHFAVKSGNLALVELAVKVLGEDCINSVVTRSNATPLDLAESPDIITYLEAHDAKRGWAAVESPYTDDSSEEGSDADSPNTDDSSEEDSDSVDSSHSD